MQVLGETKTRLQLRLGGLRTIFKIRPLVIEKLHTDLNISGPFLAKHGIDQLHSRGYLTYNQQVVRLYPLSHRRMHGEEERTKKSDEIVSKAAVESLLTLAVLVSSPETGRRQGNGGEETAVSGHTKASANKS